MVSSSTGTKYLHIENRKKYGHYYNVRVVLSGKHLIVWRGNDINAGIKVAEKVEELLSVSKSYFLEWYDYDREEWLEQNGY